MVLPNGLDNCSPSCNCLAVELYTLLLIKDVVSAIGPTVPIKQLHESSREHNVPPKNDEGTCASALSPLNQSIQLSSLSLLLRGTDLDQTLYYVMTELLGRFVNHLVID